jgi:hypothetical protein
VVRRVVVVGSFALLGAACTLVTSLDGLSGGATDAATPEASVDAGVDTGGGTPDAAADAPETGRDATVDAGTFCARQSPAPTFCKDFDDGPVDFDWSSIVRTHGEVALDTAFATSAPFAARFTRTADGCQGTSLDKVLPGLVNEAHLRFQLRLGTADGGVPSGSFLGGFNLASATAPACTMLLELDVMAGISFGLAAQADYPDGGGLRDYVAASRYPVPGAWTLVELDAVPDAGAWSIAMRLDGVQVMKKTFATCPAPSTMSFGLGLSCAGVGEEARYDDVVVDVK